MDAEGSFTMSIFKSKTAAIGWTIEPCFIITRALTYLILLISNNLEVSNLNIKIKENRHYNPKGLNLIQEKACSSFLYDRVRRKSTNTIYSLQGFTYQLPNVVTLFGSGMRVSFSTLNNNKNEELMEGNTLPIVTEINKFPELSNHEHPKQQILNSLSEENFLEWFRGLVDGEGSFIIKKDNNNSFGFRFSIYMHIDNTVMLKYIAQRLGIGKVTKEGDQFASYLVSTLSDVKKLFDIFGKHPGGFELNTSKNLNFLMWKKGYELYINRTDKHISPQLVKEILDLKNNMNRKRVDFQKSLEHQIKITPYWLLGLIEGEGYFSVANTTNSLIFGVSLTAGEIDVLFAIKKFMLDLPGEYQMANKRTNVLRLIEEKQGKTENTKPMAILSASKTDFLTNVLIPFFDSLTWFSKKESDYNDWKLILNIKNKGKHFTDEGKELIYLIAKGMNNNRLSTNLASKEQTHCFGTIQERALKLLSTPSNYEIQSDGKILIKSSGTYLKGRGNIGVRALDSEGGGLVYKFNSIKECASFFNVKSATTIRNKLDNGNPFEFQGKKLVLKRDVSLIS